MSAIPKALVHINTKFVSGTIRDMKAEIPLRKRLMNAALQLVSSSSQLNQITSGCATFLHDSLTFIVSPILHLEWTQVK